MARPRFDLELSTDQYRPFAHPAETESRRRFGEGEAAAVIGHREFDLPGRAPVQLRLLIQPEHEYLADRHFAGASAALKYYGQWYGAYPYPQLTIALSELMKLVEARLFRWKSFETRG